MLRQLVLAIFADEASADAAADGLTRWAEQEAAAKLIDTHQIQAMGVLVLDENGKLKTEKLGPRSKGAGAGIGVILAHELDDDAVAEVDAASTAAPAGASINTTA